MSSQDQNRGQQKVHTATRTNPDTGQPETRDFTQAEWRERDKSEGWTRPEGDDEGGDAGDTSGGTPTP
jgi:hypothetical protein